MKANPEDKVNLDFYGNFSQIKYALHLASTNNQLGDEWVALYSSHVGSVNDMQLSNKDINLSSEVINRNMMQLSAALRYYAAAYSVLNDKKFITLSSGVYKNMLLYAATVREKKSDAANLNPIKNESIVEGSNTYDVGFIINSYLYYYFATSDINALANAVDLTAWLERRSINANGGFYHNDNDKSIIHLRDSIELGNVYLNLFKATTDRGYLNKSENIVRFIDKTFKNDETGGYLSFSEPGASAKQDEFGNANENGNLVIFANNLYQYSSADLIKRVEENAYRYINRKEITDVINPAIYLYANYDISHQPLHITIVGPKFDKLSSELYNAALQQSVAVKAKLEWIYKPSEASKNENYPNLKKPAAYLCANKICSLPITSSTELVSKIQEMSAKNIFTSRLSSTVNDDSYSYERMLKTGNLLIISFFSLLAGILLSFAPCNLPMIPIMASIIVGNTIGVSKRKTIILCLVYIISMSITYATIGLLTGVFGLYLQSYMATTWVIVTFSAIFLILSLSMLGIYELRMPSFILNKLSNISATQQGGSFFGVIMMGVFGTLIISPCTTAPLAGVLIYIANTGNYVLGFTSLFFMGLGIGFPLLLISIFSRDIILKTQTYNAFVRDLFGMILLALSLWILTRVLTHSFTMLLASAYIILCSVYMSLSPYHESGPTFKIWRAATIMVFLLGAVMFVDAYVTYFNNNFNFTQQCESGTTNSAHSFSEVGSISELNQKLDIHNDQPTLLLFTADWCSACKEMKTNIFDNDSFKTIFSKFNLLKVDMTNNSAGVVELAEKYDISGPPSVLFFDKTGQLLDIRGVGEYSRDDFLVILNDVLR